MSYAERNNQTADGGLCRHRVGAYHAIDTVGMEPTGSVYERRELDAVTLTYRPRSRFTPTISAECRHRVCLPWPLKLTPQQFSVADRNVDQ